MSGHLVPGDEHYHVDKQLVADLSALTTQVTGYVLHYFNVDAGTAEPLSVEEERALGDQLTVLAAKVHDRADRREQLSEVVVIEGAGTQSPAPEPRVCPGSG